MPGETRLGCTGPGRDGGRGRRVICVIDNYDSFVYNLVQYVGHLGADCVVHRNDEVTVEQVVGLDPELIIISPGPGDPADAGISIELVRRLGNDVPIFG